MQLQKRQIWIILVLPKLTKFCRMGFVINFRFIKGFEEAMILLLPVAYLFLVEVDPKSNQCITASVKIRSFGLIFELISNDLKSLVMRLNLGIQNFFL